MRMDFHAAYGALTSISYLPRVWKSEVFRWVLAILFGLPYLYLLTRVPSTFYDRSSWQLLEYALHEPFHRSFLLMDSPFYRPVGHFLLITTYNLFGDKFLLYQLWVFVLFVLVLTLLSHLVSRFTDDKVLSLIVYVSGFIHPLWVVNLRVISNLHNLYSVIGLLVVISLILRYMHRPRFEILLLAYCGWAVTILTYEQPVFFPVVFSALVFLCGRDVRRTIAVTLPFWLLSGSWVLLNIIFGNPKLKAGATSSMYRVDFSPPTLGDLWRFLNEKVFENFLYYYSGWKEIEAYQFVLVFAVFCVPMLMILWRRYFWNASSWDRPMDGAIWKRSMMAVGGGCLWLACGVAPFLAYRPITMPSYTTLLPYLGVALIVGGMGRLMIAAFPRWAKAGVICVLLILGMVSSGYQSRILLSSIEYWKFYTNKFVERYLGDLTDQNNVALVGTKRKWMDPYNPDDSFILGLLVHNGVGFTGSPPVISVYWNEELRDRGQKAGKLNGYNVYRWKKERFEKIGS